jgi:hypothetical protein
MPHGPSADQGDHDRGRLRFPPCAGACGAPALRDRGRDRPAVPGWPFLPWEGLEGGPLVCLGGLLVLVGEGLAVLRRLVAIPQIGA